MENIKEPRLYGEVKLHSGPQKKVQRVERIIKLIKFINGEWKDIDQCAAEIGVTNRSIYRQVYLVVQLGFKVEKGYRRGLAFYRITNVADVFSLTK